MFAGFDYGTSNCAIGIISSDTHNNKAVQLLPISHGQKFMPSALYALERELICESVGLQIPDKELQQEYINSRHAALTRAKRVRRDNDIRDNEQSLFIGTDALNQYFSLPDEGYFVKSPKSFLGASGLRIEFIHFLEDIVTAMMISIKNKAESILENTIHNTVIGRPVNFQGTHAKKSNQQAINILTIAAKRAGFKSVEFLFEPLAAGLDFEVQLDKNKTVLVVDIGGGTTDCAMVRMGPSHKDKLKRDDDFLAHTGERIGGNDLDIQMAGKSLMPLFGMHSILKNGQPMPTQTYWNAVKINDVGALSTFNNPHTTESLKQLLLDTTEPNLLKRFIRLREQKYNYQLVRNAELCKIALSNDSENRVDLSYIDTNLNIDITQHQLANNIEQPLNKIILLMQEAITQANCTPDMIYMTGGSAKSPIIRQAITNQLGKITIVDGDHFGSVATGLTLWAQKIFK